tara:strand:+ start:3949 stop:4200 length:252 start_codon:yes stop_codon:yes gene_type:complete
MNAVNITNMKIEDAVKTITKAIKEDVDFRETYKSNIAMYFKDEVEKSGVHSPNPENHSILMTREMLHKIANKSADNFLDNWCE